ncbi:DUF2200 family protein [Lacticaseibacillus kribbianus]|uniref:DUF2200 family protein n=1 Tax=Lacticaseibacillus kribbianus TaxID=2926292 RepID=UPI001CD6AA53|nr:DUF2200 family protein [Lacticaseibacillus kribbianus]
MRKRVEDMTFDAIYPLYLNKITKKGRIQAELDEVLGWLTGYAPARLHETTDTLGDFFAAARVPVAAAQITGVICGVRVEEIEDPLMRRIRQADKVVDELARGKAVAKIRRDTPLA